MEQKLTAQERADLQIQHRKERDKRVCDRIKAVLAYDDGYSYCEISRILLLDDATIRRHIDDYFSKRKLKPENGGSQGHLSEFECVLLRAHLEEKTYLYVKDICAYVNKNFNKIYSISGMTKWLHKNKFCYKKQHGVPAKADASLQDAFIEHYKSLKESLTNDEIIYFVDSSHPQHQTRLAHGWIKKGVRKSEKMTACQKRVNIIGAINLDGHQIEHCQVNWVNAESIKAFLEQLIKANPMAKKIHLIWDNARYHKNKDILLFVSQTKIALHYLPPYSPNLNAIERLWKILNEQVTYNRYYPKFSDFVDAISIFFDNIDKYKTIISTRITDNFQRLSFA